MNESKPIRIMSWIWNISITLGLICLILETLSYSNIHPILNSFKFLLNFPYVNTFVMISFLALFGKSYYKIKEEKNKLINAVWLFNQGLTGLLAIILAVYTALWDYRYLIGEGLYIFFMVSFCIIMFIFMWHSLIEAVMIEDYIVCWETKKLRKRLLKLLDDINNIIKKKKKLSK
jgi:hypothetical protein